MFSFLLLKIFVTFLGIGMDFISLSQPPIHLVPLFYEYHADLSNKYNVNAPDQSGSYEVPHWINLQFVNIDEANNISNRTFTGRSNDSMSTSYNKIKSNDADFSSSNTGAMISCSSVNKKTSKNEIDGVPKEITSKNVISLKSKSSARAVPEGEVNPDFSVETASAMPIHPIATYNFSPFPFGQVLQKHAESLDSLFFEAATTTTRDSTGSADLLSKNVTTGLEVTEEGKEERYGCNSRTAILLRLLSLPRALENYLLVNQYSNNKMFSAPAHDEKTHSYLANAKGVLTDLPHSPPSSPLFTRSRSSHARRGSLVESTAATITATVSDPFSPPPSTSNDTEISVSHKNDVETAPLGEAEAGASGALGGGVGLILSQSQEGVVSSTTGTPAVWGEVLFRDKSVALSTAWRDVRLQTAATSLAGARIVLIWL